MNAVLLPDFRAFEGSLSATTWSLRGSALSKPGAPANLPERLSGFCRTAMEARR